MANDEAMQKINESSTKIVKLKIEAARISSVVDEHSHRAVEERKKLEAKLNEIELAQMELDGLIETTFRKKENV